MTQRIFDGDLFRGQIIFFKMDLDGVGNRAFVRVEVVFAVLRFFYNGHFFAQGINAWVRRDFIFVVVSG